MSNQNQKTVEQQQVPVQQVETPVAQETLQVQPQVVVVQQSEGVGNWLKRHWKGLTAGVAGVAATVTSAIVAYKKGKAAGVMSVPVQPQEDYSLNPNE